MSEMRIEYIGVDALRPYEKNAKEHTPRQVDQIAASIREFGFRQPIVVDGGGLVIAGHGRLLAAKKLGMERVPCVRADDLTEAQVRALRLADNKTNESAWIQPLLDEELAALAGEIDMGMFGFDDALKDMAEAADVVEVDAPEPPEEPTAKPGDIYKLGRHRMMCGDSTDPEAVAKLMDGETADLLLTDPPYNVNLGSVQTPRRSSMPIKNDNKDEGAFVAFLTKALGNAEKFMRGGAGWYIWYAGLHHSEFERAVRNIREFRLHEQLIWVKSQFVLGRSSDYQWTHECCLYGWKSGAAHYFTDSRAEATVIEDEGVKLSTLKKGELVALCEKLMGIDGAKTVLRADRPMRAELHPTVKPQALLAPLIRNSTKPTWTVLDLFGGSGSTLIACEQLGRKCRMMELDPRYADVIVRRWEEFTGERAVRL